MGNPFTILSYGGAFCLSTGAIHLFNIFLKILSIKIKNLFIFSNIYNSILIQDQKNIKLLEE